jgi:hypothetical protein
MGNCKFCGEPAGFLKTKHKECFQKFESATIMKQELIKAIINYSYPSSERLRIMDYGPEDFLSRNPEQYLYICRSSDKTGKYYKGLANFCASAFFNFLEDCGGLGYYWPNQALESLYTLLDENEFTKNAREFISRLKKRPQLEIRNISNTLLLYNERNFWAAAGILDDHFIAIFYENSLHLKELALTRWSKLP